MVKGKKEETEIRVLLTQPSITESQESRPEKGNVYFKKVHFANFAIAVEEGVLELRTKLYSQKPTPLECLLLQVQEKLT